MRFVVLVTLLFVSGMIDAISGGGGLVSMVAYLNFGLPPHIALATNKVGAFFGTVGSNIKLYNKKSVNYKLMLPAAFISIVGSFLGSQIVLRIDGEIINKILLVLFPIVFLLILNKKLIFERKKTTAKNPYIVFIIAFLIGLYDGFNGIGVGIFSLIAFLIFNGDELTIANANVKTIGLFSSFVALSVFVFHGVVNFKIGIIAALCNIVGGYVGSALLLKNGEKIVRPVLFVVIIGLYIKLLLNL